MAIPNTKYRSNEIAEWNWTHTTDGSGNLTPDQISNAALLDLAKTMRRIERNLLSLGSDGIHSLIRLQAKELQRADNKRREKIRAKARRTRKANAAKKLKEAA